MNKDYIKFLQKNRTMVISSDGVQLWITKVYYALDKGFLFLVEKGSLTLANIMANNMVSYEIDDNTLRIFVQGKGRVEILGEPRDFNKERGILVYKNPEDQVFISHEHVLIARLIPEKIRVTDMRESFLRLDEKFQLEELRERINPYSRIIRPWSFYQSLAAYGTGIALTGNILIFPALLGALALVMAHGAFNTISEYFDFGQRIDIETSLSGARVIVDQLINKTRAFEYFLTLFLISLAIGIFLYVSNHSILLYITIGTIGGLMYGVPRFGFKKLALGDLAVLIVWSFGIFLGGFALMGGKVNIETVLLSLPVGLLTVDILHANNWRDIKYDLSRGVRTVANLLGEKGSLWYYVGLIVIAYLIIIIYSIKTDILSLLIFILSIPYAYRIIRISFNKQNINFGRLDQLTAKFTIIFGVLLMLMFLLNNIHILRFGLWFH